MAFATIQETALKTGFLLPKEKIRQNKGEYYRTYYQNNRQKLLTYSNDCYQVKKLLETYLKEEKKNTKKHRLGYYQEYEKNAKRKEYKKQ
jgi:ADP-ribosylglycohydrolase